MTRGELQVSNRFRIICKIGSGSFGDIYEGLDKRTGLKVAIKLERTINKSNPMLKYEANIYRILNYGQTGKKRVPGIARLLYSGNEGEFEVMVIDLGGPCLSELFHYCGGRLSQSTTHMIADQILDRLEFLHSKLFVHRDLKPENFVMGIGRHSHHVYMLDFGLSKRYCDPKTGQHIPHTAGKSMVGTTRYASVNTHLGIEQSRRDDLEGLAMMLVYFAQSKLPWQGTCTTNRAEKERRVMEKKIITKPVVLCAGLPSCFERYMTYVRSLGFSQEPDYNYCRQLFSSEYEREHNHPYDWVFDWDVMFKERKEHGLIARNIASHRGEFTNENVMDRDDKESSSRSKPPRPTRALPCA